ncbi:YhbD family protein [Alicyclobacillus sendaiensis]|uniref:YhbD family protein n=1 Tax=Alicyclobacillus sendaiensis TaxID=192387 RepID=UPI0026F446A9|nr:YhbD family protein [Alicyclobacillus sendaiensis]
MEDELISKKELLDITGISYGQLYRWKRKKLIPEEWFIRKSTFTGQETFFPRDKILSRIEQIKQWKEDVPLDELAKRLSPDGIEVERTGADLVRLGIASPPALRLYEEAHPRARVLGFREIVCAHLVHEAIASGQVSLDEARQLIPMFEHSVTMFRDMQVRLDLVRKLGVGIWLARAPNAEVVIDPQANVAFSADVASAVEQLKLKLMGRT